MRMEVSGRVWVRAVAHQREFHCVRPAVQLPMTLSSKLWTR